MFDEIILVIVVVICVVFYIKFRIEREHLKQAKNTIRLQEDTIQEQEKILSKKSFWSQKNKTTEANKKKTEADLLNNASLYYNVSESALNKSEQYVYHFLKNYVTEGEYKDIYIFPKMRIIDFISLNKNYEDDDKKLISPEYKAICDVLTYSITSKHVDFVICKASSLPSKEKYIVKKYLPICAIEVDGNVHRQVKNSHTIMKKNDYFKNQVFSNLNFPLIRINTDWYVDNKKNVARKNYQNQIIQNHNKDSNTSPS